LFQFGFDGGDIWKTRRDALFSSLQSNPKARFVTRVVQFGSEPLFDNAISPQQLAQQVLAAKASLSNLHILITVSDMAYGFQERGGAPQVLDAVDFINAHTLPFFSTQASTGRAAWPLVQPDILWFVEKGKGKKIYLSEVSMFNFVLMLRP
jgi:exo-beta-1,3-glucanase (GH17 family)